MARGIPDHAGGFEAEGLNNAEDIDVGKPANAIKRLQKKFQISLFLSFNSEEIAA